MPTMMPGPDYYKFLERQNKELSDYKFLERQNKELSEELDKLQERNQSLRRLLDVSPCATPWFKRLRQEAGTVKYLRDTLDERDQQVVTQAKTIRRLKEETRELDKRLDYSESAAKSLERLLDEHDAVLTNIQKAMGLTPAFPTEEPSCGGLEGKSAPAE